MDHLDGIMARIPAHRIGSQKSTTGNRGRSEMEPPNGLRKGKRMRPRFMLVQDALPNCQVMVDIFGLLSLLQRLQYIRQALLSSLVKSIITSSSPVSV